MRHDEIGKVVAATTDDLGISGSAGSGAGESHSQLRDDFGRRLWGVSEVRLLSNLASS